MRLISKLTTNLGLLHILLTNPTLYRILMNVVQDNLTYLDTRALMELSRTVSAIERDNIPGAFVEAGCALGGSALIITASKSLERRLFVYDVFDMIPAPSENDDQDAHRRYQIIKSGQALGKGGSPYYGYEEDLYEQVGANFAKYGYSLKRTNVNLIKGDFKNTLHFNEPIAFAHIDCDWYQSVMISLSRIVPHLVHGGRVIIDDYATWSGSRQAVEDYFAKRQENYHFEMHARLHVIHN